MAERRNTNGADQQPQQGGPGWENMQVNSPEDFPIRGESEPWCAAWLNEMAGDWIHPQAQPEFRPETCLWKDVREYLEHRYDPSSIGNRTPVALCPSCMCELDIIGLFPASGASPEEAGRPRAAVTVCGHMACERCLDTWYRSCLEARRAVRCPMCRHELHFAAADCRHPIRTWRLPGHDPRVGNVSSYLDGGCEPVPRTLPEGGTQSERCYKCRERRVVELMTEFDIQLDTHLFLAAGQDIVREANLILQAWAAAKGDVVLTRLPEMLHAEQAGWGEQWQAGMAEEA